MKDRENRTEGERAKTAQLAGVFSVVIASFRSAACWKDAVRSVLIQDYPAIELIFCDDGSEGGDAQAVEQFIKHHRSANLVRSQVIGREKNIGTVANLGDGAARAGGRYLLHFAADDALHDAHALTRLARALDEKADGVLGVYGRSVRCSKELTPLGGCSFDTVQARRLNACDAWTQWQALCRGCCIHMGATAFLRAEFLACGGFDASYRLLEDWPFFLRQTRDGRRFHFMDEPILKYRAGGVTDGERFGAGRSLCFQDQLMMYETQILPYLNEVSLATACRVYWRYRDDREDVLEYYGLMREASIRSLTAQIRGGTVFETLWKMKRVKHWCAARMRLMMQPVKTATQKTTFDVCADARRNPRGNAYQVHRGL